MEFFKHIFENYKDNLLGMTFAYIGIISIMVMFLPKNNIISKLFKEFASIFTSLFKK
jgi:hypothetical protein|tara:strand:- start:1117 stop:1287 length:171 start_codon:yes stop_codon:yes gene_type:complete